MAQTRPTKIVTITNDEIYDLATHLARMADSVRAVIHVTNQAERDGLAAAFGGTLPIPTHVWRMDQDFLETWNGARWVTRPHAEFTTALNTCATNTSWGMGTFSVDNTQTTDTGFATINGTDTLRIRDAGIYCITQQVAFTTPISGVSWMSVDGQYTSTMGGGLQNFITSKPNWRLGANAIINPVLAQGSGSNKDFTSRITVTRIG